ncbi:MAG TPA: BON domain-containing protein [Thermoanaerobaculia bacterium]|jgi:osmotically-inducible protein OsmY|nr:BON domain-containing protein [Thermoanaerobaculia bacterium]
MKRTNLLLPAFAVLCVLGASACNNHDVQEQNAQAGDAIKTAGEETGEAVATAGNAAVEDTKAAAENAGDAMKEAGQEASATAKEAGQDIASAAETAGEKAAEAGDKAAAKMDDASITSSVKAKLIADPEVKGVAIDVDTVNGKVTLSGTAKSAYEKREAEKLARHTDGVVSVDNQIVVSSK